jgi:hypothetical protein
VGRQKAPSFSQSPIARYDRRANATHRAQKPGRSAILKPWRGPGLLSFQRHRIPRSIRNRVSSIPTSEVVLSGGNMQRPDLSTQPAFFGCVPHNEHIDYGEQVTVRASASAYGSRTITSSLSPSRLSECSSCGRNNGKGMLSSPGCIAILGSTCARITESRKLQVHQAIIVFLFKHPCFRHCALIIERRAVPA